jgi:hypothetical protein
MAPPFAASSDSKNANAGRFLLTFRPGRFEIGGTVMADDKKEPASQKGVQTTKRGLGKVIKFVAGGQVAITVKKKKFIFSG